VEELALADVAWIAVDWGTSNVRAWGVGAAGETVFAESSDQGMGKITRDAYPAVLAALVGAKAGDARDVLICGMAGARQGWLEAPYLKTPTALSGLAGGAVSPDAVGALTPRILPGVCQAAEGREDVMRGEETQLLGLLALRPGFEGTAIMPGTHSKWVRLEGGRIVEFSTAMTGELYDVLGTHSVLRHSLNAERIGPATEDGVSAGLDAGLERPAEVTGLLFRTRAAALLSNRGPDWCSGYLSGLLVGAEIAGKRAWLHSGTVPLIGSARLGRLYGAALSRIGINSEAIDATDATLAGLKAARAQGAN
jgi:2-dehydro-3-deoxygalactonokinase